MSWHALLPLPGVWCGIASIGFSIIFFSFLDYVLRGVHPPIVVECKGALAVWKWRNMIISWFHAVVIGTWDILCFYYYPELLDNPVDHVVPFTYFMVALSTGYFYYDFLDMIAHRQVFKMWELTLHHISVLGAFTYNVLTVRYIAYTVIALLAEVNSIFLHTRKLMQMHKLHPMSTPRRLTAVVNLITFAGCRGFALFRITYGMYMTPDKMSPFYTALLMTSMIIMNVLNPILFYILLRNDFLLPRKEDKTHCISNGTNLTDYSSDKRKTSAYSLTYELNGFTGGRFHQPHPSEL
uniref:TLC domain-containing protein n=1 Tax=Trichobilharzia regenti TaxID=157069 RepID=A0AA85JWA0_TRIRE|nr:unnamed protein product [Trichobilharzia regenti]